MFCYGQATVCLQLVVCQLLTDGLSQAGEAGEAKGARGDVINHLSLIN